jgi:4-alpha-glucanotransferase
MTRRAGLLLPLFSIGSSRSWGIGEIGDIVPLTRWLAGAGLRVLQLLPINEVPPGETSPYSALSAMAIDPQFISIDRVKDFAELGGESQLDADQREQLDRVRHSPTVDYGTVQTLKRSILRRVFTRFHECEWITGTRRASELQAYIAEQAWWLEDYALFRALHAAHGERPWTEWPEPLRRRESGALERARTDLAEDILYRQYLQWIAHHQWSEARNAAGDVMLFGDLPFMVAADSADVWARQDAFRLDASVGVPPDAFSETGQDWGLPVYRWEVLAARQFDWIRDRARRYADLFDGYRIDHLVGFYRTYCRPHDGTPPHFTPDQEPAQVALGEAIIQMLRATSAEITAEDLGVVPDFVRQSLARLSVPGYKVLRWERHWDQPGQPFKDPVEYPRLSVATSGTHDTEPMAVWWENAQHDERAAILAIPSIAHRLSDEDRRRSLEFRELLPPLREALLESLFASGADLVTLPVQDVFGWRDRINQPATVGAANWTWRFPWPVDRIAAEPQAVAVTEELLEWARRHGRASG